MGDVNGQVAVVTGGTRGIGLAISELLLNRGVTVAAGYATRHDHAREFADKYADRGVSIHQGNVGHNQDVLRVEVAWVVEFLADPESGYITGQVYPVNGGLYM